MGCGPSTQAGAIDPETGLRKKKPIGGAYPGNRRTPQPAYTPNASQFNSEGTATAHFVSYGGGNALVLQQNGIPQLQVGAKVPQYVQVTLPQGVTAGQTIHVQAPDGKVNEIVVPPGFGPGSTFTVEFADDDEKIGGGGGSGGKLPTKYQKQEYNSYNPTPEPALAQTTTSANTNRPTHDDGFATGFNNPGFVPASTVGQDYDINVSSYPAASDARPVYSTTPTYNATTY